MERGFNEDDEGGIRRETVIKNMRTESKEEQGLGLRAMGSV